MTDIKGIDFAWSKPSPQEVKNAGAHWVAGYISNDSTKDLTQSEIHSYVSESLPVVLCFETTATRALSGMHSGQSDALQARQRIQGMGMAGAVVYFAVDTDATWAQVEQYFAGIYNEWQSKAQIGVYGGINVIRGAAAWGIKYLWQTDAWSYGQWDSRTTIRQEGGTLFAGSADWDDATQIDYGQWPRYSVPVPPKTVKYEENDVIAYFNIPAGKTVDIPLEPAGTDAAPKGGAKNGQMWLGGCPTEGQSGTLKVAWHTYAKGWGSVSETPVQGTADKWTLAIPSDGSVDKVRLECDVDFTAYVVGRQVQ